MNEAVKTCVDARLNVFTQYYEVPDAMQAEVADFTQRLTVLGEACATVQEFEERFAQSDLNGSYVALLGRLTPKMTEMTAEQKAAAKETYRSMVSKEEILDDVADYVRDSVTLRAESDFASAGRKILSEADLLDDVTKISNAADDAGRLGKFLGGLFKKK
ncbi:MAG: hypothetical protein II328_01050 [Clostridia bacterium]|nr:hypothetical protein [Clostridia bacterium]